MILLISAFVYHPISIISKEMYRVDIHIYVLNIKYSHQVCQIIIGEKEVNVKIKMCVMY